MTDALFHLGLALAAFAFLLALRQPRFEQWVMLPFSASLTLMGCIERWGWRATLRGFIAGDLRLSPNGRAAFRNPTPRDGADHV